MLLSNMCVAEWGLSGLLPIEKRGWKLGVVGLGMPSTPGISLRIWGISAKSLAVEVGGFGELLLLRLNILGVVFL